MKGKSKFGEGCKVRSMKKKLTFHENVLVGSLLFGLFLGAGNLIFPVELGQGSGGNVWAVTLGFLISGVGLPVLGVVASAWSASNSLYEMALPASKGYANFFTMALYLTIGPFFAIPRTATVAYEMSLRAFCENGPGKLLLFAFSSVFFLGVLYFSLRPAKLLSYIGQYMTPLFLMLLSVLVVFAVVQPMGPVGSGSPIPKYSTHPLLVGFVDGYGTMDALASLAFAIIIISNIRRLEVEEPKRIALETLKSGLVCVGGMGAVYVALAYMGATSLGILDQGGNGGTIHSGISDYYLGIAGKLLLAAIVTLACFKTAIGLISSCSEMFVKMLPHSLSYNSYAILFTLISFAIANLGLNTIISLSVPVLMFLYPLSIVLMILSLASVKVGKKKELYQWTLAFTGLAAFFDFLKALPAGLSETKLIQAVLAIPKGVLPGFSIGFGWVLPAALGFILGLLLSNRNSTVDAWKEHEKELREQEVRK